MRFEIESLTPNVVALSIVGITFLALSYGVLGENFLTNTGPWCWIKGCLPPPKAFLWMTLTGKGWEILTYFLTMAFYIIMKIYMWKRVLVKFVIQIN